jgi:hypothetical protein
MKNIFAENYKTHIFKDYTDMNTDSYKRYFFNKVESLLKDILLIDMDEIKILQNFGQNIRKYEYVEKVITPAIAKVIIDHKTFLEIEIFQLIQRRINTEDHLYTPKIFEKITYLTESDYISVKMLILKFLLNEFILKDQRNTMFNLSSYTFQSKFYLGKYFNSFYNSSKNYFSYKMTFHDFIECIQTEDDKQALCFWFLMLIPIVPIEIIDFE